MDVNANIEEQRRIAARIMRRADTGRTDAGDEDAPGVLAENADDAARLAELVVALDGWLCSGGFLPRTWERK